MWGGVGGKYNGSRKNDYIENKSHGLQSLVCQVDDNPEKLFTTEIITTYFNSYVSPWKTSFTSFLSYSVNFRYFSIGIIDNHLRQNQIWKSSIKQKKSPRWVSTSLKSTPGSWIRKILRKSNWTTLKNSELSTVSKNWLPLLFAFFYYHFFLGTLIEGERLSTIVTVQGFILKS